MLLFLKNHFILFNPFNDHQTTLSLFHQAQVEMTNEADVDKLLAHYHIRPPVLKGHVLRFYEGETTSSIKVSVVI